MGDKPLVSVIIVNYNGRLFLEDCLNSLKQVNFDSFEVILVDNNSMDGSIEFVKTNHPTVNILKLDKNYGFARPNNVGAKIAKGDFLLFLNNDTKVTPNFITELINVINQNSSIAICQSLLLKPNGEVDSSGDYIDSIGIPFTDHKKIDKVSEIFSAKGASLLIRKCVFEELNGFDEKFFVSFEDVDLGWRARILGYTILLVPTSIVYHIGGQTTKNINQIIAFHGFKNQLSIKITNFELKYMVRSLFLFFLIYGIRSFRVWLDYLLKGQTNITATKYEDKFSKKPSLKSNLKGLLWVIQNYRYILKKHKLVNSTRKIKTKNMIKLNYLI